MEKERERHSLSPRTLFARPKPKACDRRKAAHTPQKSLIRRPLLHARPIIHPPSSRFRIALSLFLPSCIYIRAVHTSSLYVASIRGNPRSLSRKSNDISIPERWHLAPNWGQLVAITKEERIQLGAAFYRNPRPRSLTTELHQKEEKKKEKSSCSCNVIAAVAVTVAVLVCGRSSGLESLMNSALTEKEDPTLVTFRSLSLPHLFAPFRVFCRRLYQAGVTSQLGHRE